MEDRAATSPFETRSSRGYCKAACRERGARRSSPLSVRRVRISRNLLRRCGSLSGSRPCGAVRSASKCSATTSSASSGSTTNSKFRRCGYDAADAFDPITWSNANSGLMCASGERINRKGGPYNSAAVSASGNVMATRQQPIISAATKSPSAKSLLPSPPDKASVPAAIIPALPLAAQPSSNASKLRLERDTNASDRRSDQAPPPLTEDEDDSDGNNLDGSMQQMDNLLSTLHSKEARLNWMLEAEMEAQNTQADMSKTPVPADSTPTNATRLPSRGPGQSRDDDSPRQATRPAEFLTTPPGATGKQPPAIGNLSSSSNGLAVATSEKRTNTATDRDSLLLKRNGTLSISKMQPIQPLKSASILKLVGNSGNKSGNAKSKDELVEEYKRARRAELEAMLRTMVQR
ncbi:hypothetical protein FI667_g13454, partial [Globisporangium splendens]